MRAHCAAGEPLERDVGRGGRTAGATPPDLVVGAAARASCVGGRRAGERAGSRRRDDQRVGRERGRRRRGRGRRARRSRPRPPRQRGRRVDEVGAADVEAAQLVERVFVEVGEDAPGPWPAKRVVDRGELADSGPSARGSRRGTASRPRRARRRAASAAARRRDQRARSAAHGSRASAATPAQHEQHDDRRGEHQRLGARPGGHGPVDEQPGDEHQRRARPPSAYARRRTSCTAPSTRQRDARPTSSVA